MYWWDGWRYPAFEQPELVQESAPSIHCVDFPKAEQACVLKHILRVNAEHQFITCTKLFPS